MWQCGLHLAALWIRRRINFWMFHNKRWQCLGGGLQTCHWSTIPRRMRYGWPAQCNHRTSETVIFEAAGQFLGDTPTIRWAQHSYHWKWCWKGGLQSPGKCNLSCGMEPKCKRRPILASKGWILWNVEAACNLHRCLDISTYASKSSSSCKAICCIPGKGNAKYREVLIDCWKNRIW